MCYIYMLFIILILIFIILIKINLSLIKILANFFPYYCKKKTMYWKKIMNENARKLFWLLCNLMRVSLYFYVIKQSVAKLARATGHFKHILMNSIPRETPSDNGDTWFRFLFSHVVSRKTLDTFTARDACACSCRSSERRYLLPDSQRDGRKTRTV